MMFSIKTEPIDTGVWEADYGGQEPHCGGPVSSFRESPPLGPTEGSSKKRAVTRVSTKGIKRPGYRRRINAPFSYVELIRNAIKSSPNCMLTLKEILTHLEENNECFQGSYVGWKNSVRHNLSVGDCFVKLLRNSNRPFGKDNFWAINPDHPQVAKLSPTTSPLDETSSYRPPQTTSPLPLSGAYGETARTLPQIVPSAMESEHVDLRKCADPLEENSTRGTRSSSPKSHDSRRISTQTVRHQENSLTSGNTLPISRFLNSPPLSRGEKSKERESISPDPTASTPAVVTRRSSVTPTSPRATVPESISPPSNEGVPRQAVQHTHDEWKVLKGLYEHYWNRALQERHALFCQHLVMLKDSHDKLEYQRFLSSVRVPTAYPPVGYPGRPSLFNMYMPYGYPPKH